jgi:hypothetical protein
MFTQKWVRKRHCILLHGIQIDVWIKDLATGECVKNLWMKFWNLFLNKIGKLGDVMVTIGV